MAGKLRQVPVISEVGARRHMERKRKMGPMWTHGMMETGRNHTRCVFHDYSWMKSPTECGSEYELCL